MTQNPSSEGRYGIMKRLIRQNRDILCMSNVRGRYVVNPGKLPFSFYFSSGAGMPHSIRVKPVFNPDRLVSSLTGTLKLCDDWEYIPGKNDTGVSSKDINDMKEFFREYIVLFCAVWDEQLSDGVVEDYLRGDISFSDMLKDFDFYELHSSELDNIKSISELESFCRDNQLVNLYGN